MYLESILIMNQFQTIFVNDDSIIDADNGIFLSRQSRDLRIVKIVVNPLKNQKVAFSLVVELIIILSRKTYSM